MDHTPTLASVVGGLGQGRLAIYTETLPLYNETTMPLATKLTEEKLTELVRFSVERKRIKVLATQFHIGPDRIRKIVAKAASHDAAQAPPPLQRRAGVAAELPHWVVMAAWTGPGCAVVDHINGNPLDNRRSNLHIVTQREYMANARKRSSPITSCFQGGVLLPLAIGTARYTYRVGSST